ncbi:MAG: hypothetical protein ACOCZD_00100 [Haloferacaceae archaeon]
MSELIAAKAKGELLERYKEENSKKSDAKTESELIRELLDAGLRARQEPLYVRLGLPNRHAARLEDVREAGEDEEDVVRRALRDAVESWDDDVLDTLGASDDLREEVEAAREDGETLDDAVRRLLRVGVETATERETTDTIRSRVLGAVTVAIVFGLPTYAGYAGELDFALIYISLYVVLVAWGNDVDRVVSSARNWFSGVISRVRR